jgi:hypothetical protein
MRRIDRNRVAPFPASPDGWAGFVATVFNLTSFQQIHKASPFFAYGETAKADADFAKAEKLGYVPE